MSFKNSHSSYNIPDEIYMHIFSFLNPKDLLSVSRATEQFSEITYDKQLLINVNFSNLESGITANDFKKFMCRQRAQLIQVLNLKNLTNISQENLERSITKCTYLKSLNILNCNIPLKSIRTICPSLPHLRELYWSADKPKLQMLDKTQNEKLCAFQNMEKLYIKLPTLFQSQQYMLFLLELCPNLKSLHLDFYRPSHHSEPISYDPKFVPKAYSLKNIDSIIISVDNTTPKFYVKYMGIFKTILSAIFFAKNTCSPWKALIIPEMEVLIDDSVFQNKDICQNFSTANSLSICESTLSVTLQNVKTTYEYLDLQSLIITSEIMHDLGNCGGSYLKKLNFYNCSFELERIEEDFFNLFNTCINITELNLARSHLPMDNNMCLSISVLKKLKRLSLPACAFSRRQKFNYESEIENAPLYGLKKRKRLSHYEKKIMSPLDVIVYSCPLLEELDIRGQEHECYAIGPTEEDFFTLYKLNSLSSLTLFHLTHIRELTFLERIMHNQTLKILRLVGIGSMVRCMILPSLAISLSFSSSIESLRFDHNKLDLNYDKFWEGLSLMYNLKELCLGTNHSDAIDIDTILTSFRQLPHLRMFHLHSKAKNFQLLNTTLKKEFPHIKYLIIGDKIVTVRPIRFLSAAQSLIPFQNKLCTMGSTVATTSL